VSLFSFLGTFACIAATQIKRSEVKFYCNDVQKKISLFFALFLKILFFSGRPLAINVMIVLLFNHVKLLQKEIRTNTPSIGTTKNTKAAGSANRQDKKSAKTRTMQIIKLQLRSLSALATSFH
jgi:hypothetical protein